MGLWKSIEEKLKKKGTKKDIIGQIKDAYGKIPSDNIFREAPEKIKEFIKDTTDDIEEAINLIKEEFHDASQKVEKEDVEGNIYQRNEVPPQSVGQEFARTFLARLLGSRHSQLIKAGVRSTRELRKTARSKKTLQRLGFAGQDIRALQSFADLCRVFSAKVAIALFDSDMPMLKDLEGWNTEMFKQRLADSGADHVTIEVEGDRFERLLGRFREGLPAEKVTGIELDLGKIETIAYNDWEKMGDLGIETLEDWASARTTADLSKKTSELLDAHARLRPLGIVGKTATDLIREGIKSSYDLAILDHSKASEIASRNNLKIEVLWKAVQRANLYLHQVVNVLNNTLSARVGSVPNWMNALNISGYDNPCSLCPEKISAFSRFAYFIYLVQRTGDSLEVLEQRFHQKLSELSPESDEEGVHQIKLCIEVLSSAYPGPLTSDENMPYARRTIGCGVTLLTMPLEKFVERIVAGLPGTDVQDLTERLQEARMAPLDAEEPVFSAAEIQTLEAHLGQLLLEQILTKVKQENHEASHAEQLAEAQRRLIILLEPFHLEALPARRQVYKDRSGKSDRELYETLFIETNLDVCEKITRLDLAIRSLEGYLNYLFDTATTQQDRTKYRYLDYETWRADRASDIYPELKAYWRDDPLAGEDGFWDRGSIIADRAANRERIRAMLENAHDAIEKARISNGLPAENFVANPDLIDNPEYARNAASDFSSYPYYDYMKQGLAVIEDVLHADDKVHEAVTYLDHDQPGLSIAKLNEALRYLNYMSEKVFQPHSSWLDTKQCGYEALAELVPMQRRLQLVCLGSELIGEPKALFVARQDPNEPILSEDFRDGVVTSASAWGLGEGFRVESGHIIKNATSNEHQETVTRCFCRYKHGTQLESYGCAVSIKLKEGLAFVDLDAYGGGGEEIGIAVRVSPTNKDRYQLVIRARQITSIGADGHRYLDLVFELHLEKIVDNEVVQSTTPIKVSGYYGLDRTLKLLVERDGEKVLVRGNYFDGEINTNLHLEDRDPLPFGTLVLIASKTVGADFGPINVFLLGLDHPEYSVPPFYAPRRKELIDQGKTRHYLTSSNLLYQARVDSLRGMATDLTNPPIVLSARGVRTEKLVGILTPEFKERYLLFRDGDQAVSLDSLDILLDRCLALSYYLRFAAIPIRMAQACLLSADYESAIKYLHLIYDDTAPDSPTINTNPEHEAQVMYPGLASPPEAFSQAIGADSRLARLRLSDAYLAWAEWLFLKNTPETRKQARRLCERILKLHGMEEPCKCMEPLGELIESLVRKITEVDITPDITLIPDGDAWGVFQTIEALPFGREMSLKMIEVIQNMVSGDLDHGGSNGPNPMDDLFHSVTSRLLESKQTTNTIIKKEMHFGALLEKASFLIHEAELRYAAQADFDAVQQIYGRLHTLPGNMFMTFQTPLWGGIHWPMVTDDTMTLYDIVNQTLCVPINSIKVRQIDQACMMLKLLRSCRNIFGIPQDIEPPWRFDALLRIARNFTELALAAERDLLNFRQAYEQDGYSLVQAMNNLILQDADVQLERHNLELASGDIVLACLQQQQVQHAVRHYQGLIEKGLTRWEQDALTNKKLSMDFFTIGMGLNSIAWINPTNLATAGMSWVPAVGAGMSWVSAVGTQMSATSQYYGMLSEYSSLQAGFERREAEWAHQLGQNQLAAQIAAQNLLQAGRRYRLALERREIAKMRCNLAADAVQFLSHKFLNGAMWTWMQRVIREQYHVRLNYAIQFAYMAERALAFEVQDQSLKIVRFDYFDPRRDGLLGATQLQTDLATLENMKHTFTQRKLQLSKTISLACMMPAEFQEFRTGKGCIIFSTLMEWFDRDFPGHYLRLIKGVKVTVMALIPEQKGIHATLKNTGISRVVNGPPFRTEFEETIVRRNPQSVALSMPYAATGLFVFDYKDDLLLPFEGSGVATDWIFELPKASNPFDFRTIADVLITIEYTALDSYDYRQQVIKKLDRSVSADRAFSFRLQFPDQWYALNNPDQDTTPLAVTFQIKRGDFPPNIQNITIQQVLLYFAVQDGKQLDEEITLQLIDQENGVTYGGSATPVENVISTRGGTVAAWTSLIGKMPAGNWDLKLADSQKIRSLFKNIEDILFIITYAGETPEWPE